MKDGVKGDLVLFSLLGPISVIVEDESLVLARAQPRAVMGFLLLNNGRVTTTESLIEALWAGAEPPTARNQIHGAISAIRRLLRQLKATHLMDKTIAGYRIRLPREQLDLELFESAVLQAQAQLRHGDPLEAIRGLRWASRLWRGPTLGGATGAYVDSARARIGEQRLGAIELLMGLELARANHAGVLAELRALVDGNPMRERLREYLAIALMRMGRQVEALDLLRRYRFMLRDEHGLDPSARLCALEQAVLRNEPALVLQS